MSNTNNVRVVSFRELEEKLEGFSATSLRQWAREAIIGVQYDPNNINYGAINARLVKAGVDVEKVLGGKLGVDILIAKSTNHSNGGQPIIKIKASEMEIGITYLVISHVNRFHYTLKGITKVDGENVYIFQDERYGEFKKTQDAYRALSESELSSDRWTIRKLAK